jgi:hypothetical protein
LEGRLASDVVDRLGLQADVDGEQLAGANGRERDLERGRAMASIRAFENVLLSSKSGSKMKFSLVHAGACASDGVATQWSQTPWCPLMKATPPTLKKSPPADAA